MPIASSPSDYTAIDVDYSTGKGFYTDKGAVSDLLQVPAFSSSTYPSQAQVGSIIKTIEGLVDEKVKRSFRPIIWKNEFHNFEFIRHPMQSYYGGYVGFIQLDTLKVKKIISLKVWQGNQYQELASASASITLDSSNYNDLRSITLQLPNSGSSWILYYTGETSTSANNTFNNSFGSKTTAQEICHLINEEYPANTAQFTNATTNKFKNSEADSSIAISDFFYASVDPDDGNKVNISSLLAGEDGSNCTIAIADKAGETSDTTTTPFTDMQDMKRLGSFWTIMKRIDLKVARMKAELYIDAYYEQGMEIKDLFEHIWYASTEILPNLEVQVVIDSNDAIHISSGSSGYVDFTIDPVGMKLPIKTWIHTHPFGSAYFSGTDIRTVRVWEPLMKTAHVLGGDGHYGSWFQEEPNQLKIYRDYEYDRTQVWNIRSEEE